MLSSSTMFGWRTRCSKAASRQQILKSLGSILNCFTANHLQFESHKPSYLPTFPLRIPDCSAQSELKCAPRIYADNAIIIKYRANLKRTYRIKKDSFSYAEPHGQTCRRGWRGKSRAWMMLAAKRTRQSARASGSQPKGCAVRKAIPF